MSFRVGLGIDFHRLKKGRRLILGGVQFEYPLGLFGHSDADVIAHAAADALLGAAKLGDLGKHFSNKDPQYKDADSLRLLKRCAEMVRAKGFELVNLDLMVILEEPKLEGKLSEMEKNLAEAIGLSAEEVSVKATRPERMGALGRKEGIACFAICLIRSRD